MREDAPCEAWKGVAEGWRGVVPAKGTEYFEAPLPLLLLPYWSKLDCPNPYNISFMGVWVPCKDGVSRPKGRLLKSEAENL